MYEGHDEVASMRGLSCRDRYPKAISKYTTTCSDEKLGYVFVYLSGPNGSKGHREEVMLSFLGMSFRHVWPYFLSNNSETPRTLGRFFADTRYDRSLEIISG